MKQIENIQNLFVYVINIDALYSLDGNNNSFLLNKLRFLKFTTKKVFLAFLMFRFVLLVK